MAEAEELEQRIARLEERVAALAALYEDAIEQTRRAVGRLDRAAEYCRGLAERLEAIEQTMRRQGMSIHVAGGVLMRTLGDGQQRQPSGTPS
jgi:signal transduction histidine kinase